MISINGFQSVKVVSGCNFFMHLHKFLFFFVCFPSSIKKKIKYITVCLLYLSFIQILRVSSFVICLKYFPSYWDTFHYSSSYIFYYPGIFALWYLFSSKSNESVQNHKKKISKYLKRIFLFIIIYHGLFRPLQISINAKIVTPYIEKILINNEEYKVKSNGHHTTISLKRDENQKLHYSIPFGQLYFFLLFFLNFKPYNLIKVISIYNLALIPLYALAIIFFFNGYLIFGDLITLNEKFYRLVYLLIFLLRIIRPNQFK